mgnify:CR=1 FL=1
MPSAPLYDADTIEELEDDKGPLKYIHERNFKRCGAANAGAIGVITRGVAGDLGKIPECSDNDRNDIYYIFGAKASSKKRKSTRKRKSKKRKSSKKKRTKKRKSSKKRRSRRN